MKSLNRQPKSTTPMEWLSFLKHNWNRIKKNQVFQSLRINHIWYKMATPPTLSIYSCLDLKWKGYTDCSIEELLLQSVEVLKYYYSLVFWLEQSQEIGLCCNQMYSEWASMTRSNNFTDIEMLLIMRFRNCYCWTDYFNFILPRGIIKELAIANKIRTMKTNLLK